MYSLGGKEVGSAPCVRSTLACWRRDDCFDSLDQHLCSECRKDCCIIHHRQLFFPSFLLLVNQLKLHGKPGSNIGGSGGSSSLAQADADGEEDVDRVSGQQPSKQQHRKAKPKPTSLKLTRAELVPVGDGSMELRKVEVPHAGKCCLCGSACVACNKGRICARFAGLENPASAFNVREEQIYTQTYPRCACA